MATPWAAAIEVNPVTLLAVVPSVSYNSKVVEAGFLTVNTCDVWAVESISKLPVIVTCWPSIKLWPAEIVTTPGLADVHEAIVLVSSLDILS